MKSIARFVGRSHSDSKIYSNVLELIGSTPMIRLNRIPQDEGLKCDIVAKCEFFNPGGSIKDRIALEMIEDAEEEGLIFPGKSTIIEATSGNTGVGLAVVSAVNGYDLVITMPEKMSMAKENVINVLGGKVVRTPNVESDDPESNFSVARNLSEIIDDSLVIGQFDNLSNPKHHYNHTGLEIWEQSNEKVDMFVFAAGTGGTITGISRRLKELNPDVIVVSADPVGSSLFDPERTINYDPIRDNCDDLYQIEGIGYDFTPSIMDTDLIDYFYKTEDAPSFEMATRLIREEGLLCGGSSGAILDAAVHSARYCGLGEGDRVVVILPDSIRNYVYKFVDPRWLEEHNIELYPRQVEEIDYLEKSYMTATTRANGRMLKLGDQTMKSSFQTYAGRNHGIQTTSTHSFQTLANGSLVLKKKKKNQRQQQHASYKTDSSGSVEHVNLVSPSRNHSKRRGFKTGSDGMTTTSTSTQKFHQSISPKYTINNLRTGSGGLVKKVQGVLKKKKSGMKRRHHQPTKKVKYHTSTLRTNSNGTVEEIKKIEEREYSIDTNKEKIFEFELFEKDEPKKYQKNNVYDRITRVRANSINNKGGCSSSSSKYDNISKKNSILTTSSQNYQTEANGLIKLSSGAIVKNRNFSAKKKKMMYMTGGFRTGENGKLIEKPRIRREFSTSKSSSPSPFGRVFYRTAASGEFVGERKEQTSGAARSMRTSSSGFY